MTSSAPPLTLTTLASSVASSASQTASPYPTTTPHSSSLVPLLPAVLGPLLFLLLILPLVYVGFRRHHSPEGQAPRVQSAFVGKPAQYQAVVDRAPTTPTEGGSQVPKNRGGTQDPKSPNEKFALLPEKPALLPDKSALRPGFIAQHHRASSSMSSILEVQRDDELASLIRQNQSLLQRLTLGWSRSPTPTEPRRPSGNTLERGMGVINLIRRVSRAASSGQNGSSSGQNRSSSGKYERIMPDDQLFYRKPGSTQSSKGSSENSGRASLSGTWGEHIRGEASHWNRGSVSVGVPETPETIGTGDFGRFSRYRDSGERMRFPLPPGDGTLWDSEDVGKRDSVISTDTV